MATTDFTTGTVIESTWLNDVDEHVYGTATTLHPATVVSVLATGGISSTDVQAALEELDAEKQPIDATLTSIALLGTAANKYLYTTAVDTWAEGSITAFARTLLDDSDAATARTTLGISESNSDGEFRTIQVFTTSGTYTKPAGLARALIYVVGGGGGGYYSGGGGGGSAILLAEASAIGATETVTIGSGGAAQNAGGTTSVGSLVSATGGAAGKIYNTDAPAGGIGSDGTINIQGSPGGNSYLGAGSNWSGGHGGDSIFGGGGTSGATTDGGNASGYGGGGGGRGYSSGSGGTGHAGVVFIKEYY